MTSVAAETSRDRPPVAEWRASTGTYALLLRCRRDQRVRVASLGLVDLPRGWLLYIGSAFGPGGLAARLRHHASLDHVRHWHLDYVRSHTSLVAAWVCSSPERLEHRWARSVAALPDVSIPADRLGSSDCCCRSHLFALPADGPLETTIRALRVISDDEILEVSGPALRALARNQPRGAPSRRREG